MAPQPPRWRYRLLYAWRGRWPPSRIVGSAGATAAGRFVPITVVDNRPVATVSAGDGFVPLPSATIEIELPNGCQLRMHERVAASTLRKVVAYSGEGSTGL